MKETPALTPLFSNKRVFHEYNRLLISCYYHIHYSSSISFNIFLTASINNGIPLKMASTIIAQFILHSHALDNALLKSSCSTAVCISSRSSSPNAKISVVRNLSPPTTITSTSGSSVAPRAHKIQRFTARHIKQVRLISIVLNTLNGFPSFL